MRKITLLALIVGLLPTLSFADGLQARLTAYEVISTCAAKVIGYSDRTQIDISLPANHFFGDNPAIYNRCAVARLNAAGVRAVKLSLMDYSNLGPTGLDSFINEIAVRSAN
jgi:hypothetical protein